MGLAGQAGGDGAVAAWEPRGFMRTLFRIDSPKRGAMIAAMLVALVFVVVGVLVMTLVSPQVPYADQWRFYARLIEQPFPANVLAADNGHREVLPNLVRLAELRWFGANQQVQIAIGVMLALATWLLLARVIWRDASSRALRVAAVLLLSIGVFWLGNQRALAHANDAVHAYLVTTFLVLGLMLVARARPHAEAGFATLATLCALAATFSFGSGVATLPALLFVLALRRAPLRAWLPVLAGLVIAVVLYVSGAGHDTTTTLRVDVFAQLGILLRWLAAPFVYVFWPLLDAAVAAMLPTPAREIALPVAGAWTGLFGDVHRALWPQALIGAIGIASLIAAGVRERRMWRLPAPAPRIALGVAFFALAVGAIVAISRLDYFLVHPDQVQAPRYLVWSSLFWSALAIAALLRMRRARLGFALAFGAAALIAPSEVWMGRLASNMQVAADQAALGGVVGVLARDERLGETVFDELAHALPLLEREGVAMYAWPESPWLDRVPPTGSVRVLDDAIVEVDMIDNRFGGDGMRVRVRAQVRGEARVLILDAQGNLRGMTMRDPAAGSGHWRGWIRGRHAAGDLRAAIRVD